MRGSGRKRGVSLNNPLPWRLRQSNGFSVLCTYGQHVFFAIAIAAILIASSGDRPERFRVISPALHISAVPGEYCVVGRRRGLRHQLAILTRLDTALRRNISASKPLFTRRSRLGKCYRPPSRRCFDGHTAAYAAGYTLKIYDCQA